MRSSSTSYMGTWSMKEYLKDSSDSSGLPETSKKLLDRAPEMKILHATDSNFQNVVK